MEVLATSFTNEPRVALVDVDIGADILPELLEHKGAACEVQSCEARMRNYLCNNLCRRAGYKLDDTGRNTRFFEDLVDEIVRVGGSGRRLPYDGIADQRRGYADLFLTKGS